MMNKDKRKNLQHKGWKIGGVDEFLGLSAEESGYIELKLDLCHSLRERRMAENMTQTDLARRLGTSQSRVAKMESGDPSVSVDLLIRSLLSLGMTKRDLARSISGSSRPEAA